MFVYDQGQENISVGQVILDHLWVF